MHRQRAFTLIELLVAIAVAAVVLTLAAPSFSDYILMQRLKGVSAQLTTDMQLARSEAVARNTLLRVVFGSNSSTTCYTLYTSSVGNAERCNCLLGPGAACTGNTTEVRTVQVDRSRSVQVQAVASDPAFAFDPVTGRIYSIPSDDFVSPSAPFVVNTSIDDARTLRTTISTTGRPSVCGVSTNLGASAC